MGPDAALVLTVTLLRQTSAPKVNANQCSSIQQDHRRFLLPGVKIFLIFKPKFQTKHSTGTETDTFPPLFRPLSVSTSLPRRLDDYVRSGLKTPSVTNQTNLRRRKWLGYGLELFLGSSPSSLPFGKDMRSTRGNGRVTPKRFVDRYKELCFRVSKYDGGGGTSVW